MKTLNELVNKNYKDIQMQYKLRNHSNVRSIKLYSDEWENLAVNKEAELKCGQVLCLSLSDGCIHQSFRIAYDHFLKDDEHQLACVFFVSSMTLEDLSMRWLLLMSGMTRDGPIAAQMQPRDWIPLANTRVFLEEAPVFMGVEEVQPFDDMLQRVESIKKKYGLGFIVLIDSVMLSSEMALLAECFNVPVISIHS